MKFDSEKRRVWAEIDLNAVERNYNLIKDSIAKNTKVCCVIKANAYGHGAIAMAKFYEQLGVELFAVSNIEESLQLRKAGVKANLIILGYTDHNCAKLLADNKITQCVYSYDYALKLSNQAVLSNVIVDVHIKIDTGMGRIGFKCLNNGRKSELEKAYDSCKLPNLQINGIFTHFSVSDEGEKGEEYTKEQYNNFQTAINYLEEKGVSFAFKHCSNSGAICDYKEYNMDFVRAGIMLYGIQPSSVVKHKLDITPVMTLKAVISHIKTVYKGESINYGRTFIAQKEMKLATIPLGYADGFWRSNSGKVKLTINGKKVDIVGRICMDQLVVDVTDIENLSIGDEVVIFGDKPYTTVNDMALVNQTIPYEVVCDIGIRVPRLYIYNGQILSVQDYLL